MKPRMKTALYVIGVTISGAILAFLLFGVKPTPVGLLGCFLVPVAVVLVKSRFKKPQASTQV